MKKKRKKNFVTFARADEGKWHSRCRKSLFREAKNGEKTKKERKNERNTFD